jgi:branched-chain amino acid transport system permease protein
MTPAPRAALWGVGTIVVLAALPWLLPGAFYVGIATHVLVFALFALSLNIILGYGGMTSLGHAVYLGVSAYACAWLVANAGFGALPAALCALAIGTLLAAFFGVLALRARGLGFLMITLALGQVVWGIAYRWVGLTGGDNGIQLVQRPRPFGIDLSGPFAFYYAVCCVFLLALSCLWQLARSPFGACLRGTRDQPRRMRMMGHNVWAVRWVAFVLSGFWASVAGLLYVYDFQFISPQTLALPQSAEALLMVVLGGAGTLAGPIAGAVIITLVKDIASSYDDRWYSLLGVIFILVVVFMPDGLVPGCRRLLTRLRRPRVAVRAA